MQITEYSTGSTFLSQIDVQPSAALGKCDVRVLVSCICSTDYGFYSYIVVQSNCWSFNHHVSYLAIRKEGSSMGMSSPFKHNSQKTHLALLLVSEPLS